MSPRGRIVLAAAALLAYVAVYFPLAERMGASASALVLVPLIAAGLLLGARGAFWLGILSWPINHGLVAATLGEPYLALRPSELLYVPLTIAVGVIVGLLSDLRARLDASLKAEREARQRAEDARRDFRTSEARLAGVLASAPETILIVDASGAPRFANRDMQGRPRLEDWTPGAGPELRNLLRAAIASGSAARADLACSDGRRLAASAAPVRAGGRVEDAVIILSDVTERQQTQETMHRAEKLASLGTLVAGVAHEINNPLTYMRGNLELAQLDLDEAASAQDAAETATLLEEGRAKLDLVAKGIDRIADITKSLRRISHARKSRRSVHTVDGLARAALARAAIAAPPGVQLLAELSSEASVEVDEEEMLQLMVEVISNAVEACADHPDATVVVATRDGASGPTFEVADNGPGLAPHVRAQLFTPFLTTKEGRMGLGLSVARRIAEDHEADLSFDSKAQGAVFRLRLAAARTEAALRPRA